MRVLLFTGKGGVGKTTVAAATALRCAAMGRRTVVVSTDPAHSLADSLDRPLRGTPTPVADSLWGLQIDATERLEETWGEVREYMTRLFDWAGLDAVEAEELAVLPGLDELFALTEINSLARGADYDVVIVDCAPTADTIRLLSLPEVLSWYMQRVFPVERRVMKLARPVLSRMTSLPMASEPVFDGAERLYRRLEGVRELLSDRETTSLRLVLNPEKIVMAEARRTATYLGLFGYHVDAVVANRLLPDSVSDPWFKAWKESHACYLDEIEQSFAPLPVLRGELAQEELVGPALLEEFARCLYGELDPAAIMYADETVRVEAKGEGRVLALRLPFVEKDELDLGRHGDELLVRVGPYRRPVSLPDSLRRRQVESARVEGDWLEITFGPVPAAEGVAER
ncbi:MAG: ArsA family ATPase [Acidimicrobiales bacterium]